MESMFDKLTGRDNPAKKLQKEIENIQFKKQSLVSAVQAEIREASLRRDGILCQVGRVVFDNRGHGWLPDDAFAKPFAEIAALDTQINEKEVKINEIIQKYDEEAEMLSKMLHQQMASQNHPQQQAAYPMHPQPQNQAAPTPHMYQATTQVRPPAAARPQPAPAPGQSPCPQCGTPYTPGVDGFCINCGQNLIPAESAAYEAPPSFCSNCGSKYVAGESLFCDECGEKL